MSARFLRNATFVVTTLIAVSTYQARLGAYFPCLGEIYIGYGANMWMPYNCFVSCEELYETCEDVCIWLYSGTPESWDCTQLGDYAYDAICDCPN